MSILKKVTSVLPGKGVQNPSYLALLVTYHGVETALWRITNAKLDLVSTSAVAFGQDANILDTAAEAIDQVCQEAKDDVEDVILGLPDAWISNNQILPQYFDSLKDLANNLDIVPFAFVAQNHAITNRLKVHYGTLLAGFLVSFDKENITVSSINGGHLMQSRYIKTDGGDIVAGLQKIFAHFTTVPVTNTTVYVCGTGIPENISSVIEQIQLFKDQKPTVTQLPTDYLIHAIALAGAVDRGNTLGIHVEDSIGQDAGSMPMAAGIGATVDAIAHEAESNVTAPEPPSDAAADAPMPKEVESPSKKSAKEANEESADDPKSMEEEVASAKELTEPAEEPALPAGFVVGADIAKDKDAATIQMSEIKAEKSIESSVHAGEGSDVEPAVLPIALPTASTLPVTAAVEPMMAVLPEDHPVFTNESDINFGSSRNTDKGGRTFSLPKLHVPALAGLFHKNRTAVGSVHDRSNVLAGAVGKLAIIAIFIIVLVGGSIGTFFAVAKADVHIDYQAKVLEGDGTVTASTKATDVNASTKTIPLQEISTDASKDSKNTASGKKKVGDKAKGTVIIYNKTASAKSFSKGQIVSAGSVTFVLNDAITIPARVATESADREITIKPGKGSVGVTASDIGTESNISAGTNLTVKGFGTDNYDAAAEGSFSGGSSKDVTVVSDDDVKKAKEALLQSLQEEAKTALMAKIGSNQQIVDNSLQLTTTKQTVSPTVGTEAKEFTLTLQVTAKATAYSLDNMKILFADTVKSQVPENYTLDEGQTTYTSKLKKIEKNGDATVDVHYQTQLAPKVDLESVKNQLAGRSIEQATITLQGLPNVSAVSITITPHALVSLKHMPLKKENITFTTGVRE